MLGSMARISASISADTGLGRPDSTQSVLKRISPKGVGVAWFEAFEGLDESL